MASFDNNDVAKVFSEYEPRYRKPLMSLRRLILQCASESQGVGKLEETLKWGQPSYLTNESKSGSTVRIDWFSDNHVALLFNCQTTLVEDFRCMFGDALNFSKNRAIVFDVTKPLPEDLIRQCVTKALRYKLDKKLSKS